MADAGEQRLVEIFSHALRLDPLERPKFLEESCGDDPDLYASVLALLRADANPHHVLQDIEASKSIFLERSAVGIGQTVSRYRILEKVGEGGMGVVYRAEDTRLNRSVALKFLPRATHASEQARTRFNQEAQAAAALDHPNICTLHDIDESEDHIFIAMAYLEGRTLRERLSAETLPIDEILRIAVQIAEGLGHAHRKGIVHRDIKPANIMVSPDGHVRIMDFGLARSADHARITRTGLTMGTVAYLSPEQARADTVDHRTDIWSLGVVLYEMVTGELPFPGEHDQAIIYAILNKEPKPITEHRLDVQPQLQEIIAKSLAKDARERYASVEELLHDLTALEREMRGEPGGGRVARLRRRRTYFRSRRVVIGAVAAVTLAAGAIALALSLRARQEPAAPPAVHRQLTYSGNASLPEISPNGKLMVYAMADGGNTRLMLHDITTGSAIPIIERISFDRHHRFRWSPDGSMLALTGAAGEEGSFILPWLGGTPRRLCSASSFVAWSPDGSRVALAAELGTIRICNASGDETTRFALGQPSLWIYGLDWSPRGDDLVVASWGQEDRSALWLITPDGERPVRVLRGENRIFLVRFNGAGNALYYLDAARQSSTLMKLRVNPSARRAIGEPEQILSGISGEHFSVSADGAHLLHLSAERKSDLWMVEFGKSTPDMKSQAIQLTQGTFEHQFPSISPDGRQVAFVRGKGDRFNVFVMPLEGGAARQLTFFDADCTSPAWSPDGTMLAFQSNEGGTSRVWIVPIEGGAPRPLSNSEMSVGRSGNVTWWPGSRIAYQTAEHHNIKLLDPSQPDGPGETLFEDEIRLDFIFQPRYSPDGKELAFWRNRYSEDGSNRPALWVISLEDRTERLIHEGRYWPEGWSADGNWIYATWSGGAAVSTRAAARLPAQGGEPDTVITFAAGGEIRVDVAVTPDESKIIYVLATTENDVWLTENFDTSDE